MKARWIVVAVNAVCAVCLAGLLFRKAWLVYNVYALEMGPYSSKLYREIMRLEGLQKIGAGEEAKKAAIDGWGGVELGHLAEFHFPVFMKPPPVCLPSMKRGMSGYNVFGDGRVGYVVYYQLDPILDYNGIMGARYDRYGTLLGFSMVYRAPGDSP